MALELKGRLSLDGQSFFNTLKRADAGVGALGINLKRYLAGGFVVGALTGFARSISQYINQLDDLQDQLGISAEQAQKFQAAFQRTGLGSDALASSLLKLSDATDDALAGGDKLEFFQKLGIDMAELATIGDDTGKVMERVAKAVANMDRAFARGALRELFGKRGGERIFEALVNIAGGGDRAQLTNEEATMAGALSDEWDAMKTRAKGAAAGALMTPFNLRKGFLGRMFGWGGSEVSASGPGGAMGSGLRSGPYRYDEKAAKKEAEATERLLELHQKLMGFEFDKLDAVGQRKQLEDEIQNLRGRRSHFDSAEKIGAAIAEKELQMERLRQGKATAPKGGLFSELGRLTGEIQSLKQARSSIAADGDAAELLRIDTEIAEKRRALSRLSSIPAKDIVDLVDGSRSLNQLQQIGGYAGAGEGLERSQMARQIDKLDEIVRKQEETNRLLRENSGGIG